MVYRAPARGQTGAALVFRAGQADETLPRRGLTHLVEHLALPPVDPWSGIGGRVDLLTTSLFFQGEEAHVRSLLHDAAEAIGEPPLDRLDVERRVLAVEGSGGGPDSVLLDLWYGAQGPGLAAYEELGLRGVGTEQLTAHARRWFCRGNAALVLVGDFGEDTADLRLPEGPRRPPAPAVARDFATLPAEVPHPGSPLALGAPLPEATAASLLAMLLERRVWAALRHERGLAYDIDCRLLPVGPGERMLVLSTDVPEREASPAARALVEQVQRLGEGDFTDAELEGVRRDGEDAARAAPPLAPLSKAAASELVRGAPKPPQVTMEEWAAVTREDVTEVAGALAGRMLLACPQGATSGLLPAIDLFAAPPVQGRRFATRTVSRHTIAFDVIAGDEGVSMAMGDGAHSTVRYDSCVAAVRGPGGGLSLVDASGDAVRIDPGDLRDGAQAVAAAEARLDPGLIVPADERLTRVEHSPGRRLRPIMVGEAAELVAERLGADEELRLTAEATQGVRGGVLAVTDRRVLFVAKLLSEHVEDIPLGSIAKLRRKPNPLWPALVVEHAAGKAKFTFTTIGRLNEAADAIAAARAG